MAGAQPHGLRVVFVATIGQELARGLAQVGHGLFEHRFELALIAGLAHYVGREDEAAHGVGLDDDLGVVALAVAFGGGHEGAFGVDEVDSLRRGGAWWQRPGAGLAALGGGLGLVFLGALFFLGAQGGLGRA